MSLPPTPSAPVSPLAFPQWRGYRLSNVAAIALALMLLAFSTATAQVDQSELNQRENDVLERWLEDRGLSNLLLQQLETRLESTTDLKSRQQVAQRLAVLYGQKLLSADEATQELIKRTRSLIALYPQLESGRLRVAMLHARYLEGETSFRDWIRAGAAAEQKNELQQDLSKLEQDLSSTILSLRSRSEELFASQQLARDQRPSENERQMVDAEALHCQFLAGWTRYFRALISEQDRSDTLEKAELGFREFLQLDPQTILSDFDSKWFDFSSVWHVRAMAGLAAIETARENESLSTRLYELMESNAVSRDSREAVIRFRYLGHCYCGQFADAMNVLRDRSSIRAMSREGRIRLWVTVLETSQATGSEEIKRQGLTGLTRNLAGELLVKELDKQPAPGGQAETFDSLWTDGYAEFWKSQNGDPAAAETAADLLQKALRLETANPNDKTRCRYLQAWLMLTRRELENAIGTFSDVAQQLASVDPQLASEAAWLAARTSIQLSRQDPSKTNDAWNRLGRFVRTWPDSPNAPKAGFEKLRIELRSMPAEVAIGRLEEIGKNDESYGASLFEIAAQNFRRYESQPNDPKSMAILRQACDDVQSSAATSLIHKARASFLLVNVLLRSDSVPVAEIKSLLLRSESLLQQANEDEAKQAIVENLYYQLQLEQREGKSMAAFQTASRIVELGQNTRFEIQALVERAKYHDAKLKAKSNEQTLNAAIASYQQLSQKIGSSPDQLKSSTNARVALSRLGELQQMAGRETESESIFQSLVSVFPGNANYLRSLAIAKGNRDVKGATEIWRRLASGSQAGSDLWYASKLKLAEYLAAENRSSAARLIQQTMQLGGEVPAAWRDQFDSALKEYSDGETNP